MKSKFTKSIVVSAALLFVAACQTETVTQTPETAPKPTAAAAPAPQVASASAGTISRIAQFDMEPAVTGGTFGRAGAGANRSKYMLAGQAKNIGGELHVCGVRAITGLSTQRFFSELANRKSFYIGDKLMISRLSYFTRTNRFDDLDKKSPTCKSTGLPWVASYASTPWSIRNTGSNRFGG